MLPLLPEQYRLGLFPGISWLRSRSRERRAVWAGDGGANDQLVQTANELLSAESRKRLIRPAIDLTFTDQAARVVMLPWQDRLRTSSQMARYAEACLADSGVPVDSAWMVQASFRRFGSSGLGLGVRRTLVTELVGRAHEYNYRLRSLLPLSVAAYWSFRGFAGKRQGLLLLQEENRFTSLRYLGAHLHAIDVEPVMEGVNESVVRLLRRQCAQLQPDAIEYWSACNQELTEDFFNSEVPGTSVRKSARTVWNY